MIHNKEVYILDAFIGNDLTPQPLEEYLKKTGFVDRVALIIPLVGKVKEQVDTVLEVLTKENKEKMWTMLKEKHVSGKKDRSGKHMEVQVDIEVAFIGIKDEYVRMQP